MIDYVRALFEIYEPPINYRDGNTYEQLKETWGDSRELPTKERLEDIFRKAQLADSKKEALAIVDDKAERFRASYLTSQPTQILVYVEKKLEVNRYFETENPRPSDFPWLSAGVGIDGETIQEVAARYKANTETFTKIGTTIETQRLRIKDKIRKTTTTTAAMKLAHEATFSLVG